MTGKKIKVALCLSGEPRSSMFCFPYIYESFINLGPQYEVDVYIHSWKNFRALPLYNPKNLKIEPNKSQQIKLQIPPPYTTSHYQNHTLMHYSIGECFNLIQESYDIYIRCRLDLIFDSKLILYPIFLDILNNQYDIFSLHSDYPTKPTNGIDDQILISNFKGAKILSQYRDQILSSPKEYFDKLTKEIGNFTAEGYLKYYLDKQDIKVISNPLSNYRLVRNSQITTDEPFNFLDQ
jgi:hypothetical protein